MAKLNISSYPILAINFISMLGISLVLLFLIFFVEKYGGNTIIYGIISAMYPAFELIGHRF